MHWHSKTAQETLRGMETEESRGLSREEAARRLLTHGPNRLTQKKGTSLLRSFLEQFSDFMVVILLAAAAVSFGVSLMRGDADYVDPIIIIGIVLLNTILGVAQESKAEKAIEALQKLTAPHARVRRDGETLLVSAEEVVPGDILLIETGDYVPADARILKCHGLFSEESALTGESVPVEKDAAAILPQDAPLGDLRNMLLCGCAVTSGRATAVVTATGMETRVGMIAKLLSQNETPMTPLQKKLADTGKLLGTLAILICAAIFVMGLMNRMPPFEIFMTSVSLAVAAIPEGLPAIVTIMLAIGVQRMAKNNAIVRKLPAVETLGSATVICSDKTGTLTQNRMTVTRVAGCGGEADPDSPQGRRILMLAALCSNASVKGEREGYEAQGDPTEAALVMAAARSGEHKDRLSALWPRLLELPFDSTRKRMTTVHRASDGRVLLITKGAPDMLLPLCVRAERDGRRVPLSPELVRGIEAQQRSMAEGALRVLAVAFRELPSTPPEKRLASYEQELCFAGLVGMVDPPRPEVKEAVRMCRRAGIRPVMITGDHVATATAIAREIGILGDRDEALTGTELSKLDDETLTRRIHRYSVFARVSPEHKVRIVKALQLRGAVAAMTGDGVNDAPALKAADIGCAMGIAGTDVAKGAADMVLADDNFATIVKAVREGRGIYLNIRKAIHFLLSSNIGEILTIFVSIFLGWPAPLLPIQLLWVNLVTDSLPAIALGVDEVDDEIMDQKPVAPQKGLFSDGLGLNILLEGIMIGVLALVTFRLGASGPGGTEVGRTMAFAVLGMSQLVHAFNMRSEHSLFKVGVLGNTWLVGAFFICLAMQVSVIAIPPLAALFKVVPLNAVQWGTVAALSLAPLVILELKKSLFERPAEKTRRVGLFGYK